MNAVIKRPDFESGIDAAKERFEVLAGGHLQYGDEEIFAMQALTKNDFVFSTANKNPRSVQLAMINVASTGLTLNPAHGYAYLVPRDNAIVLDISYKGLIKIATDTGAILWARAECVHENDRFDYRGPAAMPEIRTDPFRDRGEIIGAYCVAKTAHGDILCEVMDRAALEQVRSASRRSCFSRHAARRSSSVGVRSPAMTCSARRPFLAYHAPQAASRAPGSRNRLTAAPSGDHRAAHARHSARPARATIRR